MESKISNSSASRFFHIQLMAAMSAIKKQSLLTKKWVTSDRSQICVHTLDSPACRSWRETRHVPPDLCSLRVTLSVSIRSLPLHRSRTHRLSGLLIVLRHRINHSLQSPDLSLHLRCAGTTMFKGFVPNAPLRCDNMMTATLFWGPPKSLFCACQRP